MKITIEIPDEELKEAIIDRMTSEILAQTWDSRLFRKDCIDTIKAMIYKPEIKGQIIEKTVKYAAQEIRRKAAPLLANKLLEENNE